MNADAAFGVSCMGYHSSEVAFGSHGASGFLLFVWAEPSAALSRGPNRTFPGREKRATHVASHVASPPAFALDEYTALKSEGRVLRKNIGHWAPRRFPALHYAQTFGSPSTAWEWAAAFLPSHAPDPSPYMILLRDPGPAM